MTNPNSWIHDWKYWEKLSIPTTYFHDKFLITKRFFDPRVGKDGFCKYCGSFAHGRYIDLEELTDEEKAPFMEDDFSPHYFWCKKFVKTLMERLLEKENKKQRKYNAPQYQILVLVEPFMFHVETERLQLTDPSASHAIILAYSGEHIRKNSSMEVYKKKKIICPK